MTYTAETLAYDTYERLKATMPQLPPSTIPRLITLVPSALRLLPMKVKERFGNTEAELYRKNFDVSLSSGKGSLSAHTDLTSEPMIPSEIVKVTHGSVPGKLYHANSESTLSLMRSTEYSYFAVEDNTLYTMQNNDRTILGGTAIVRAAFVPDIGSVKFSHEPLLPELMIELFQPAVRATSAT